MGSFCFGGWSIPSWNGFCFCVNIETSRLVLFFGYIQYNTFFQMLLVNCRTLVLFLLGGLTLGVSDVRVALTYAIAHYVAAT